MLRQAEGGIWRGAAESGRWRERREGDVIGGEGACRSGRGRKKEGEKRAPRLWRRGRGERGDGFSRGRGTYCGKGAAAA